MLRVTCDTNIIISGLNFPGNPKRILNLAEAGIIRLAISDSILAEVAKVLRRRKFGWPEPEIERTLRQLPRFADHVQPKQTIDLIKDDPADNRILECAVAAASEYLVSGDKHLLSVGRFSDIKIVSPAELLNIMQGVSR